VCRLKKNRNNFCLGICAADNTSKDTQMIRVKCVTYLQKNRYVVYKRKIVLVSLNLLAFKILLLSKISLTCLHTECIRTITDINVNQETLFIYLTILYLITTV